MDKLQVVSLITHKWYYTGTMDECQNWLSDFGLGWAQFDIFPFDSEREEGDISETY